MGHRRVQNLGAAVLLAVGVGLAGCRGQGGVGLVAQPDALPRQITAEWLEAQPGPVHGAFTFHLLDAQAQPVARWDGLQLRESGTREAPEYALEVSGAAPEDMYLYVTYPSAEYALDTVELAPDRSPEYLLLAVPHRIPDVVVVGLARTRGYRDTAQRPGLLATLRFARGEERVYRDLSRVNEDPASAPVVEVTELAPDQCELSWDERNIGDYNNNSQVEIADITPLGAHLKETVATAPVPAELMVIDGNGDGQLTINDLTEIGRNFQRYIQGYRVYHATGASPLPADYTQAAELARATLWASLTPALQRQRLHYVCQPPVELGANHYYVAAYSADESPTTEGPPSAVVDFQAVAANLPPAWQVTIGLTSAVGVQDGIRLTFGQAVDPEGGPVTYVLRYVLDPGSIGDPGTLTLELPEASLGAGPPYTYVLQPLATGATFRLLLTARDDDGNATNNTTIKIATVPELRPATGPWPYFQFDPQRTGANPAAQLDLPLELSDSISLGSGSVVPTTLQAVASSAGGCAVPNSDGGLSVLAQDGSLPPVVLPPPVSPLTGSLAADGDFYAAGTESGLAVYNGQQVIAPVEYSLGGAVVAAPLLLGDFIFAATLGGQVFCLIRGSGEEAWHWTNPALDGGSPVALRLAPAADATYLYLVDELGNAYKLNLKTGTQDAQRNLGATPVGDAVALDAQRGNLWLATSQDRLLCVSASDFTALHHLPRGTDNTPCAPCLIPYATPPLAVGGVLPQAMIEVPGEVYAVNLEDGSPVWTQELHDLSTPLGITATADRLIFTCNDGTYFADFGGRLRQFLAASSISPPVPDGGYLAYAHHFDLAVYATVRPSEDGPPVWNDVEGISAISNSYGLDGKPQLTVEWEYAVDDHDLPVFYAVYLSLDGPPDFDAPYTNTQVFTDIPPEGEGLHGFSSTHTLTLTEAELGSPILIGHRYYAGVRAYDAPWAEFYNIDPNTNWRMTCPPWQREELPLDGTALPTGEISFMRGLVDPEGVIHLVYNDNGTGGLAHIWGATGAWQSEGPNLGAYQVSAFEPEWGSDLVIAWANALGIGIATRTGPDAWSDAAVPGVTLPANPMLSLALGAESALAYTEWVALFFPPRDEEEYYLSSTVGGVWQVPGVLDDLNYCGRDLDLVLGGPTPAPWCALQRGLVYTPNRVTPEVGTLQYAVGDGAGGFALTEVDAGANAPDSDCGKRVQQVLDASGMPHLAYLDLNAYSTAPARGQLKYAYAVDDGSGGMAWAVETLGNLDLSFQSGSDQFTYGELGLALLGGQPVIALLDRRSFSPVAGVPHNVALTVWFRGALGGWTREQVTDAEPTILRDREPCVLALTPDGVTHVFWASVSDIANPHADKLVHLWRAVP